MCDCIKQYNSLENWQKSNPKITSVELEIAAVQFEDKKIGAVTTVRMNYTVANKKRQLFTCLPALYCPFCGAKYGYKTEPKENEKAQ